MIFVSNDKVIDSIGDGIIETKAIEKARSICKCCIEDCHIDNKMKLSIIVGTFFDKNSCQAKHSRAL